MDPVLPGGSTRDLDLWCLAAHAAGRAGLGVGGVRTCPAPSSGSSHPITSAHRRESRTGIDVVACATRGHEREPLHRVGPSGRMKALKFLMPSSSSNPPIRRSR